MKWLVAIGAIGSAAYGIYFGVKCYLHACKQIKIYHSSSEYYNEYERRFTEEPGEDS